MLGVGRVEPPLSRALGPAFRKQAGVALALCGEAGIGKTHALAAALAVAPCRHHTVRAAGPLAQALSAERPRTLSVLTDAVLSQISRGDAVEPGAAARALADLIGSLAPFVLAFEDAHEADEGRLALLDELGRLVRGVRGGAVVLTLRHEPPAAFRPLRLEPLDRDAAAAVLEGELGHRVPEAALDWIHARAAGNPLFTLAYFRHLARQGHVWSDGRAWHWRRPQEDSIPTTVEALLEQPIRLAREAGLADVLEATALLQAGTPASVRAAVAGTSAAALHAADRSLEARGLLRGPDFVHPLFREVTTRTIPPGRRSMLARRAVAALAAAPESAARYAKDAGLPSHETARLLIEGAQRVRERDLAEAGRLLAAAVPFAPPEQRAGLAVQAARILQRIDHAEARRLLQGALNDEPGNRDAIFALAEIEALDGRAEDVAALLSRLPSHPQGDPDWTARTVRLRFAMGAYREVVEAWRGRPDPSAAATPGLAYRVAFSLVVLGDLEDGDRLAASALRAPALSALHRARLLSVRGLAASYAGDRARAGPLFEEAVAAARASGHSTYLAAALHNRATYFEETNDVAAMLADTREALGLYAEARSTRPYASTLTKLARILHEMGRYEEAESHFLESRSIHLQGAPSAFAVTCEAQLGQLYVDWRSPHARALAHKHGKAALAVARTLDNPDKTLQAYTCLSIVETWLGHPDRAMALLEELETALPGRGDATYQTVFARAWALERLAGPGEAEAGYARAMAMAFEGDWHVYGHKIGLELDRIRGDVDGAARRLAWFEAYGLHNGANLARHYFPSICGGAAPEHPPAASTVAPRRARADAGDGRRPGGPPARPQAPRAPGSAARRPLSRGGGRDDAELLDALYPGASDAAAGDALKQLVFQARKALGSDAIVATATGYALGQVGSDAEDFLRTLDPTLWRGPYREDLEPGNGGVEGALKHALATTATALVERDPDEARRLALLMLRADPYDRRSLLLALRALAMDGRDDEARAAYAAARERLAEVGDDLPAEWRAFVAENAAGNAGGGAAPPDITGISPAPS